MILTGAISHTLYVNENFSIRRFRSSKAVELPDGKFVRTFSIKGNFIPDAVLDIQIEGDFDSKPFISKDGRKSFTFNVSNCEEVKNAEEFSILKYLASLRGVGYVLARSIYHTFGLKTFEVLDNDIEALKKVRGIGARKYEIISQDYLSRGVAKELFVYLDQFHISNTKINRLFRKYREKALSTVKNHPYSLYLQKFITYNAAEKIARANGLDSLSEERIQATVVEALRLAEQSGNTYLEWGEMIVEVEKMIGVLNRSYQVQKKIAAMIRDNARLLVGTYISYDTVNGKTVLCRKITSDAEQSAAENIKRLMDVPVPKTDYLSDILAAEQELGFTLSDEQRSAVQAALTNSLSIVTGGPGTGKTSFQQILLNVYKKHFKEDIVLGAPTGRAARRMTESSGYPARTLHQILNLVPNEDGELEDPVPIEAGLVIIDEMSMVDTFLADKLFSAIQAGTKAVCIGDVFQLPSVGCGDVLHDMIDSKVVPVTIFTKVFRQEDGSLIAANASAINKGITDLEYGQAFTFIQKTSSDEIAEETMRQYKLALDEYGIEETTVLTPYRRSTVTGVNGLNPKLKALYEPYPAKNDRTNKLDKMDIYKGDKVMFTKNVSINGEMLSNGDIGYITDIKIVDNIQNVIIDFRDGRVVTLFGDDLENLVQAYSTTVHKSQGSEYKCCIVVIDPKHSILLMRNLVYTAITRSKKKIIIVGDYEAFCESIVRADCLKRKTLLKHYLTV